MILLILSQRMNKRGFKMGVKLELAIRDGWKQKDNERFGQCMEIRFINTADGKIMFRYAPKLDEKPFWDSMWEHLEKYDGLHKQIYSLVMRVDGEYRVSDACCVKGE